MKAIIILACSLSVVFSSSNYRSTVDKDAYHKQLVQEMPGSNFGNTIKLTSSEIPNALYTQVFNLSWSMKSLVSASDSFDGEPKNIDEQDANGSVSYVNFCFIVL